jgi:nucleoside-diphosphate-sugar epimerase
MTSEVSGGEMRRVAVTGATGFTGSHLVKRLAAAGKEVRGLARDPEKAAAIEGDAAAVEIGDITDRDALRRLFTGADAVIHLVSNFRTASDTPEQYRKTNVEGTQAVIDIAAECGIKRLVHCSTIGVHGHVKQTPANEESPYAPGDLYQETKLEAELMARKAGGAGKFEVVVVRPCSIYGPGDMRMLKMFKMLAKRRFFMLGPCLENFHAVFIDDLTEGYLKALDTPGIDGEVFLVGGPAYLPLKDYVATAARAVGAPPPWIWLPYWPFFAAAALCEAICVPFGIEPPLHRRRVRFFKNNRAFSIDKARKRLGYEPKVSLEEGMARTVAWYRQEGFL